MKWLEILRDFGKWFGGEYIKDYRDGLARLFELRQKNNTHINQIILTVSVASLTAIAALNERIFEPYGLLSFCIVLLFVLVILLSVINLYLSSLSLADAQDQLTKNLASLKAFNTDMKNVRFTKSQRVLNVLIIIVFCSGLIAFLALLGFYILEVKL